jgi:predicted Holliday junction resolvase-like endonuclease
MDIYTLILIFALLTMAVMMFFAGKALGKRMMFEVMNHVIEKERADAIKKSRSILSGQFSQHLAPYFPHFPGNPTEARFLGSPIDFVVFEGLDEKNVKNIYFVEIKTGTSKMNPAQQSIRKAIEDKRVFFREIKIDEKRD